MYKIVSASSIVTYISALKHQFHHYGLNPAPLSLKNVTLRLATCLKSIPQNPALKWVFTVSILNSIIQATQVLHWLVVHPTMVTLLLQSQGRDALSQMLRHLGLSQSAYTFHAFRRSGASLAFTLGVPMQYIQAHGTWASQAFLQFFKHPNPTAICNHLATF